MEDYILVSNNLTKRFGNKIAVNNVSMHIKKGTIYGFIGRNGAGKTTFMKMITGMISSTSGDYTLLGKTGKDALDVRKRIGCLIEAPGIYPELSGYTNLKLKCIAYKCFTPEYVNGLLSYVGLAEAANNKAGKYSLGMKQRLGIAMALIGEPEMLILDEPINGLDPQGIVEVRNLLHKLVEERNMTILISSHILSELSKVANFFGIIDNGVLVKECSLEELDDFSSHVLKIKVDDHEKAIEVLTENGYSVKLLEDNLLSINYENVDSSLINKLLVNYDISVYEIFIEHSDIEDVYLNLTGGEENV